MLIPYNRSGVLPSVSIDDESVWWAVYIRHQHEKAVADSLSAKGFEVFLPLCECMRRWKDRTKLLSLPLFPGYVFVRGGARSQMQVIATPGVHMILSRGDKLAIIPEADIQAIRTTIETTNQVEPYPFLTCGDRVRLKQGPLEGIEGILVRKKNVFRLVLSVAMLAIRGRGGERHRRRVSNSGVISLVSSHA